MCVMDEMTRKKRVTVSERGQKRVIMDEGKEDGAEGSNGREEKQSGDVDEGRSKESDGKGKKERGRMLSETKV